MPFGQRQTFVRLTICRGRVGAGDEVVVGSCVIETSRIPAERLRMRDVVATWLVESRGLAGPRVAARIDPSFILGASRPTSRLGE